ncbi:MAG: hypothetical protein JWP40_4771 [Blastococcus sp.]|nr:hypothetical protein [Blastococcus sp.]
MGERHEDRISTWALPDVAPTTVLDGTFGITGSLAATTKDPTTVLVSHPGKDGVNDVYAMPLAGGTPTMVTPAGLPSEPRGATDVAIGPNQVAWADNGTYGALSGPVTSSHAVEDSSATTRAVRLSASPTGG